MGDPDHLALLYVQQFLQERSYFKALRALEEDSGLLYDETKLEKGGELMQLVWQHMERSLQDCPEQNEHAQEHAEDEAMLQSEGAHDFPQAVVSSIEGAHSANILCVKLIPGQDEVLTGAGDGCVRRISFGAQTAWTSHLGGGGVLCVDLHPKHASGPATQTTLKGPLHEHLCAAGSMDGCVRLIDTEAGACVAFCRSHSKYAGGLTWVGDRACVSVSYDHSVVVHHFEGGAAGHEHATGSGELLTIIRRVEFASVVQHVAALHDGHTVVIAVRDSCFLRILDTRDKEKSEMTMVNINAAGDNHVSFFPCHVAVSPCGRLLLVSTNKGRLLVLRQRGASCHSWRHCPTLGFMQLAVENFHNFSATWHSDSCHVFAAAAGAQVWVYHVGTGKVASKLNLHKINVRGMDFDGHRLVTCSFDRTVKVLTHSS
ncbi:WD40-repeat-containing domain protein [Dunaliella salina]|uniref:WD40-repeat-containing domain protein n=1 Tax=Dunaliella salina TaxID=3046 RepID=A0ABQ7G0R7_DUNSA|nr:WD40-repeat-containing domain protein [Dunaliella salina]|eukprot:KAF5828188.1 WD40-repeat-containing domain protein [Dunaliella salina]